MDTRHDLNNLLLESLIKIKLLKAEYPEHEDFKTIEASILENIKTLRSIYLPDTG